MNKNNVIAGLLLVVVFAMGLAFIKTKSEIAMMQIPICKDGQRPPCEGTKIPKKNNAAAVSSGISTQPNYPINLQASISKALEKSGAKTTYRFSDSERAKYNSAVSAVVGKIKSDQGGDIKTITQKEITALTGEAYRVLPNDVLANLSTAGTGGGSPDMYDYMCVVVFFGVELDRQIVSSTTQVANFVVNIGPFLNMYCFEMQTI